MGKRIIAIILAFVLGITTGAETAYAAGAEKTGQFGIEETISEEPGMPEETEGQQESEETEELQKTEQTQAEEESENLPILVYYTISFDTAGGTPVASLQVEEGELPDAAAVGVTERKGYFFSGWVDENGRYCDFSYPITKDTLLTAAWIPITYTVRFDANGGMGTMPDQILTYDREEKLKQNSFTRTGYIFEGWEFDGIREYKDMDAVKNLADVQDAVITLKAVWSVGNYKVRFDANGGSGSMKDQALVFGETKSLYKNKYKRAGYTFKGWNTRADGTGKTYANKEKVKSLSSCDESVVTLYAVWAGNPYRVSYRGNGADSGRMYTSSHIYGTKKKLSINRYSRRGYSFAGWNTRDDGTGTTYRNGAEVSNLTTKKNETVTLYATWKCITYKITYVTKGGKMKKSSKKSYTVESKRFTLPRPYRKGYDFDGWYKDRKYKERIGEVKTGRIGNLKVYAKWVKCTRNPKKNSAKINTCTVTKSKKVKVAVSIKNRVVSDDDYYYLVYLNPSSKKPYKMAARAYKKNKINFYLPISENWGYVNAVYGIAVKKNGKYQRISDSACVKCIKNAAGNRSSYQPGATKKGIQFSESMAELDACGAKNNFLNLTASMVWKKGTVPYVYNGKTYYFNSLDRYREIVSECNRKKINVSMQVMLDWVNGQTDMIAAKAREPGARFYTWNISSDSAREKMEAMFSYVGMVFGKKNCYVSNWILGNEVNNPGGWNHRGSMSDSAYFRTYAHVFRSLYYAVRSQYASAKVFICVDNFWNVSPYGGFSARKTIDIFAKELNKIQKGLHWNLAYHAYSYPLTNTKFWKGHGITYDKHTPYVTMKNLKVLTDYIRKKYGSSVRIILSEQGYSSIWGKQNQAAAIACSYYIAACNPMVDAFIIRSYSDHPIEVAQGLSMGIAGKEAFQVYKYMDTGKSARYTRKYLKVIGIKSWKQIVPGYSKSKIRKMYRKS